MTVLLTIGAISRPILKITALTALVIFMAGCQSAVRFTSKSTASKEASAGSGQGNKDSRPFYEYEPMTGAQAMIVREAERWIGTPYCWGGDSFKCTDCSGFVRQVYLKAGIQLPRTAAEQFMAGSAVDREDRHTGDLIFFTNGGYISHVGIYVGSNHFIHASSSTGVMRSSVDEDYFKSRFAGYRRVLRV